MPFTKTIRSVILENFLILYDVDKFNSPPFEPLRGLFQKLPQSRLVSLDDLNVLLEKVHGKILNSNGKPVTFVCQTKKGRKFEETFEPRAFLKGEVLVRPNNCHDILNALVWIAFPKTKAVINHQQYLAILDRARSNRSPRGDALTLFDEDGVIVFSTSLELIKLVRTFRWKDLFWKNRRKLMCKMKFIIFGHALYEKMLSPRLGITGKSILIYHPALAEKKIAELKNVDTILSSYILEPKKLSHGRALSPVPILGLPGWHPESDNKTFYDNVSYFRLGRTKKKV